jgi:CubicO group peptidase (beta-lactamase class C family)
MSTLTFEKSSPESVGIPADAVIQFTKRLAARGLPMHSLLLMRHDKLIFEGYYAPCDAGTQHRMFSISKSFTAIAVGLLAEEGRLSLEDPIVKHFPEKLPNEVHPWIAAMTIKDMLMMRSCHAATTYKLDLNSDWVESFFTTPPTHPAGTLFHYDTSAPHTLCALVEKMTGLSMLDYLKKKLAPLGLSEQSYMLKDPFGVSMGGSGLVAYPLDLLKFGYFIAHRGCVLGQQLLSASYIDMAVSHLSDTCVTAPVPSEAQGYGMQFWRGAHNGYTCYGMGGQLIIFLPDYDMICVTTADTQDVQGGNQQIYDALYEELLPHMQEQVLPEDPETARYLEQAASSLRLEPLQGALTSDTANRINGKTFRIRTDNSGFESFTVRFDKTSDNQDVGTLSFLYGQKLYAVQFGLGNLQTGSFPLYDMHYAASGVWLHDGTLYIKAHIIDSYVGSVHFQLSFGENDLTIFMRKKEESLFHEFDGHLYGRLD